MRAFPGHVCHNRRQTDDSVVRVETAGAQDDPLIAGFLEDGRDPLWWLEQASYPIEVLDPQRVRVLIKSREVGERWGAEAVAVTFDEGRGTVVHLLSHLYLQRSDVRGARDAQPASTYLAESGSLQSRAAYYAARAQDLSTSEVVSAMSSARLLSNVVLEKRRRSKEVV